MSWIDDEAQAHKEIQDAAKQGIELIARSNYWAALIQRLRDDVESINNHDYWRARAGSTGLRLEENAGWYQIIKSGSPEVIVKFRNAGNIEVERDFHDSPYLNPEKFKHKEVLHVGAMGNSVIFMTTDAEQLSVPQEAARYILKVVMEALKHSEATSENKPSQHHRAMSLGEDV